MVGFRRKPTGNPTMFGGGPHFVRHTTMLNLGGLRGFSRFAEEKRRKKRAAEETRSLY